MLLHELPRFGKILLRYCLEILYMNTGMEISDRPFARGDRIYDRTNSCKSEVARLASWLQWLDHVNVLVFRRRLSVQCGTNVLGSISSSVLSIS